MSAEAPQITGQRKLAVERCNGSVAWRISEFDNDRVMLIAEAANAGVHIAMHFDAEQWVEFRQFIAGGQS